ncbi:invasion associated locus B family protein [Limimaricola cinnabarinus]|jgi:invasion protein IalB|uniref:invasion associated locus B family protein n=1 Tax=Limimaricola cinnabarinus TaxID=1125964 RepID=UPI002FE3CDEB
MPTRLTLLASAALLALATPLAAQETAAPDEPAETAAPAEPAAPEAPADSAAEAPTDTAPAPAETPGAAERPGQPYIAETHDDWALRCMRAPEGETDPCQLYQLLEDGEGNAVAEVSLLPLGDAAQAAAGVTVVVPLETLLTEALSLSIDGGETARYPFSFCNPAGCVARFGLSDPQLAAFKRGRAGELRIVPAAAPDREVTLEMSLTGFTAGFDAVSAAVE